MYTRQEVSRIRQQFWTAFGQYMQPITSSEGEKINWVNYRTGAKDIYFRMEADKTHASISIELSHADHHAQASYFDRLQKLKSIFTETMNEQWTWERLVPDEHGKLVSRIYSEMKNVNIMNQSDWPALISFFKQRIIALDSFWNSIKDTFH